MADKTSSTQTRSQANGCRRSRLSAAVSATVALAAAQASAGEIEEIIVTATKRAESTQDVSIVVQAVTSDDLRDLSVETFDEYVEYLPNVIAAGNGPGKKELYIRGSATEQTSVTLSTAQGSAPGVALYLDEQPVSFGGRNLDVYAADIERIEVLSGPQGTLFGASSQSGNLRLITRKPDPTGFDAGFDAGYRFTSSGADSANAQGFVNVPLTDSLAVRAVVYSDNQGGWVDNIPASFTPSGVVVDRNSAGYGPALTPRTAEQRAAGKPGSDSVATARNDGLVRDDWNDASYQGGRFGLSYDIGDDWEVLVQHTAQTLETEGTFLEDPSLIKSGASAQFSPDYNRDEFGLTTWTLTGRIRELDVVYTGGRLAREVDSLIDYTHYNNGGGYITYYLCSGNVYDLTDANNCMDPTKRYVGATTSTRTTHEARFTTDPVRRWRLLGGVYLNEVESNHVGDFQYLGAGSAIGEHISNYNNDNSGDGFLLGNTTLPTAGVNSEGPRPPATVFFNDYTRTADEVAVFAEVAVDLSDAWSVSLSARRYDLTSQLQGASNFTFGCRYGIGADAEETSDGRCNGVGFSNDVSLRLRLLGEYANGGDDSLILNAKSPNGRRDMFRSGGNNAATLAAIKNGYLALDAMQSDGSVNETDTIVKFSVNWAPTDDALIFATYSEGYRPATQNRNAGQLAINQKGVFENYVVPAYALTDTLKSYEFGTKTDFPEWFLRLNATAYRTEIHNLQVGRFDPSNVAFLIFVENVGDARSTGLDIDFKWQPTDNWSFVGAASFLSTEVTRLNPQLRGIAVPVGAELPLAPTFSGNIRARRDFFISAFDANAYMRFSLNYRGESVSGITGSAEFMEDTLYRQTGRRSQLPMQDEGTTFGTVEIPALGGGTRLPRNTRYVNKSAVTTNLAFGVTRDGWLTEFVVENLTNQKAPVVQVAGHFTPLVSVKRPRTIGMRFSYSFQ